MHAHKLALAMMMFGSTAAHAQFGMTPMMNPLALANPLAVLGLGGMVNPMGMGMMAPIGSSMMSAQMYNPQAMMNPYLNPMAANNPYLNPMAGMGNPFLPRQASPSFFPMMPGTPAPAYGGYGYPAAPAQTVPMPFFPMMPAAPATVPVPVYGNYGAPAQATPMPFFPLMPASAPTAAPKSTAPAPVSTPFDPAMWMQMMGGMAPATPASPAAPAAVK